MTFKKLLDSSKAFFILSKVVLYKLWICLVAPINIFLIISNEVAALFNYSMSFNVILKMDDSISKGAPGVL